MRVFHRALLVLLTSLIAALVALPSSSVRAQGACPPAPTTTTMPAPATTLAEGSTTLPPSTTVPPATTTTLCTTTTTPGPIPTTGAPAPGPTSTVPLAPSSSTTSSTTTTTMKRLGYYADQVEFWDVEVVNGERLAGANGRLASARASVADAQRSIDALSGELAARQDAYDALTGEQARQAAELLASIETFEESVIEAYIRGRPQALGLFHGADQPGDVVTRRVLLEEVIERDQSAVDRLEEARDAADQVVSDVVIEYEAARDSLSGARDWLAVAQLAVFDAETEVEVWQARSAHFVPGFVFPVRGPVSVIDSWGFPRSPGTPYEHWHEGADIFAPTGAELVAAENGFISRITDLGLGGQTLYITGDSGTEYYYAHLSSYADGVREGLRVRAGDVVAYNGDSGNARGGLPHLHFEIKPGAGDPVNPHPLLFVAQRREAEADALQTFLAAGLGVSPE